MIWLFISFVVGLNVGAASLFLALHYSAKRFLPKWTAQETSRATGHYQRGLQDGANAAMESLGFRRITGPEDMAAIFANIAQQLEEDDDEFPVTRH